MVLRGKIRPRIWGQRYAEKCDIIDRDLRTEQEPVFYFLIFVSS